MELSLVIPCYNEEKRLKKTFFQITGYIKKYFPGSEIIFINDGSSDKTLPLLNNLKNNERLDIKIISYNQNRGKGFAIRQGLIKSGKRFILLCDVDLSTPLSELDKFLPFVNKYDILIGSRKQKDSLVVKAQSPIRDFLGRGFSYLSKVVLRVNVNDFTCGFKLIRKDRAKLISQRMTIDRWSYDSEILKIASIHKLRMKEIGVIWKNDQGSKVKLSMDIVSSFTDLVRILINSLLQKYD